MRNGEPRDYSKISVVLQGTPIQKKKTQLHDNRLQRTAVVGSVNNKGYSHSNKMMKRGGGKPHFATTNTTRSLPAWTGMFRLFLVEIPLGLVLATLLAVYAMRNIYQDLYVPLMDRATRTDADLDQEFTYYHRYCTEADVTTRNIHDLVADTAAPVELAVEQMMQHGAVVIRDLLTPETVRKLRAYADYRNTHIPNDEVYPVSQGKNRMSFGYDATENPIVVQALQELAHHKFLQTLLATVLGDPDPASSEITSITAYYNAPPQAWHSDTKEDGNALKFGRTYSHSYSLFLPLQNTTKAMGMTDLCPGTHYCGNDLSTMCENTKMSLANADPSGPHFPAGDGALLNQIVWHRGATHRDPNSLERIVFIVSFLARPDVQRDPRQLSRGTYFHQKWNMWGHTWTDLMDPMLSMQKPLSYLRCLSIWKPPTHSWGYDLITSGFMRFSNEQLDDEAISARLWPRLDQIHFPEWLRSDVPDEYELGQKESWKFFLSGTMERTLTFLRQVFWKSQAIYLGGCLFLSLYCLVRRRSPSEAVKFIMNPIWRLSTVHSIALLSIFFIWYHIRNSPWGRSVLKGVALMRPFPEATLTLSEELALISSGPTTFPANNDVLFDTRYDAKFMGKYERYMDWHKGNKPYLKALRANAPFYESYQRLPEIFDSRLVETVLDSVYKTHGRFLQQDYRNGAWLVMSNDEIETQLRRDLSYAASGAKTALRTPLRRMIAMGRFGFGRETAMKRKGVVYLHLLENRLTTGYHHGSISVIKDEHPHAVEMVGGPAPMVVDPPLSNAGVSHVPAHRRSPYSSAEDEDDEPFPVGCTVYVEGWGRKAEPGWDRGEVMAISTDGLYTLALESGYKRTKVPRNVIHTYNPTTEGDHIQGCFEDDLEDCYPGTVVFVQPDGSVNIEFDDGDFVAKHPNFLFYAEPIKYIPPERG